MKKSFVFLLVLAMAASILVGCQSNSQEYPTKPIKLIIPTKPGGDIDQNGRLLSASIEKYLGQPMVAVNQDGGGGNVAIKELLDAKEDGYQFIYFNTSWITGIVADKYKYDVNDLEPVVSVSVNDTLIFAVPFDSEIKDAKDLAKRIKEEPETVKYAATIGAPSQFHALAIEKANGGKFKKIDVGSGADKTVALVSGSIDVLSTTIGLMKDYISTDKVRAIGSICAERSQFAEDIPTFNEQGIDLGPGFAPIYTIYCKVGTPQNIKDKVIEAVKKAMEDPEIVEKFKNSLFTPKVMYGQELVDYLDGIYTYLNSMKEEILNDKY